ncbi:MAG: hypothetical protein HY481_01370 [Candidatus Vogelbacteria bacterium]|nr:hypothetical protein [Candidatus Vogelbacteria bacterium]
MNFLLNKLFWIEKVWAQLLPSGGNSGGGSGGGSSGAPITNPLGSINEIKDLITKILDIVIQIGLPAIALAIVYTGFLFVKARGNEAELTQAKTTLFWTVIGAAVILGAFVIQTAIEGTVAELGR